MWCMSLARGAAEPRLERHRRGWSHRAREGARLQHYISPCVWQSQKSCDATSFVRRHLGNARVRGASLAGTALPWRLE